MTRYPANFDSFLRISSDPVADVIQLSDWNDLAGAANAIQEEFGVGINGNAATFGERIGVQLSDWGGLKKFEAGEVTGYISSGQGFTITLATGRFTETPQIMVCAQDKTFTLNPTGPSIFFTQNESRVAFQIRGVRSNGQDPNAGSSITASWLAYRPVTELATVGNDTFTTPDPDQPAGWLDGDAVGP